MYDLLAACSEKLYLATIDGLPACLPSAGYRHSLQSTLMDNLRMTHASNNFVNKRAAPILLGPLLPLFPSFEYFIRKLIS